jgi:phage-related protein (TIGR01555 family)
MRFLKGLFSKNQTAVKQEEPKRRVFTTDFYHDPQIERQKLQQQLEVTFAPPKKEHLFSGAMDSIPVGLKLPHPNINVPDSIMGWYASQGFIGYQNSAMLAQHWLIAKACLMPAQDAMRKGYEITSNDGEEIDPDLLNKIREGDVKYNINKNLVELIQMGRVFGIRIAMFVVETDDPEEYYSNPFNIDGVPPQSYRGISQIDPYWITPQLDDDASGKPGSIYFYEPTWWRVTGISNTSGSVLIHRTHLIIYRTEDVADILKPTYIYGGVPVPQKIYERVYAAERTANEAPMLAMTKRTDVIKTDMTQALANQGKFEQRMMQYVYNRNNFGVKTIDTEEEFNRFDTSLAELDAVIMTQYQIVAAACNVPAVKLLGTSPKGFHSTGEHEEANYHEFLESLQETGMTQLVERHHQIMIKSDIDPDSEKALSTCIKWNELDAMTAKEQAEINKLKAEAGNTLITSGAIDGLDERKRIISDKESGYNGLIHEDDMPEVQSEQTELEDA